MATPARARVVIIGGGVVVPLWRILTRLGWKDVVVLERKTLTGGSVFHAALVGQLLQLGQYHATAQVQRRALR